MRMKQLLLKALCLLLASQPAAFAAETALVPNTEKSSDIHIADGVPMPPDPAEAAICWKNKTGFLIRLPEGWRNVPESATHYNLCLMGIPDGFHFHDVPALLYPQIFSRSLSQSPADVADKAAQVARRDLARAPGGENITVRAGESFVTSANLLVEVRYFDNGPYPNVFEAVAYVMHDTDVLSLVLSAKTKEARDTFLPALLKSAHEVLPMRINDERTQQQQD